MALQRTVHEKQKLDFPFAFINIILLLLFFFIVTGSIVGKNETSVAPPITSRLTTERLPRPLLAIERSGALFLDEVPTSLDAAIGKVKSGVATDAPPPTLNVIADRSYPAQAFLETIDVIRHAGIPVRIVTLDAQAKN